MQTVYANEEIGFDDLMPSRRRDRYVLAPIVDYDYRLYGENFANEDELFQAYRLIGNHVLIPNAVAEEFNQVLTIEKLALLGNQNLLASTLVNNEENADNTQLFPLQIINYETLRMRTREIAQLAKEIWSAENI